MSTSHRRTTSGRTIAIAAWAAVLLGAFAAPWAQAANMDVAVTKSANLTNALVGDPVVYTVAITNKSINSADSLIITDLLPGGVTYTGHQAQQGTYTPGSGAWAVGSLAAGSFRTLIITGLVNFTAGTTITNIASYTSSSDTDTTNANNVSTAKLTLVATDLGVKKVASTNAVDVGNDVDFTISVTNVGPLNATGIQVSDLLPSSLTYVSNSPGAYNSTSGIWTAGSLAVGSVTSLTITATLNNNGAGQVVTNRATLSSAQQVDANAANNTATASFQAGRGTDPDLAVPPIETQVIPAGSYVIPMDTNFQAIVAPFNMKAYGLVNRLLTTNVPVMWAIAAGKTNEGIDFTASTTRLYPTSQPTPSNRSFRAGPFIVVNTFTNRAKTAITNFGNSVAVYRLESNVTVDIRYTLTTKPQVVVLDDGGTDAIHTDILVESGVPTNQYTVKSAIEVRALAATSCFTIVTAPHYAPKTDATAEVASVRAFVESGGNFLAQCHSVLTYESNTVGHFHTTLGITDPNDATAFTFENGDSAYSQFQGGFEDEGGSCQDWTPIPGSSATNGMYVTVRNAASPTGTIRAAMSKLKPGNLGGLVFYLGGHTYAGSPIGDYNGRRMYMNAVMMPSGRPEGCGFSFGTDLLITKDDGVTTVTKGQTVTYTITVTNRGPVSVFGATVADLFPTEITNAVWTNIVSGGATVPTNKGVGAISQVVNIPVGGKIIYKVKASVGLTPDCLVSNVATVTIPNDVIETNPNNNRDDDVDYTPSTLSCPPDLLLSCLGDVPAAPTNVAQFVAAGGTATNCCGSPITFTFVGAVTNGGTGCAGSPLVLTRTYQMIDTCGLGNTSQCSQVISVSDTNAPALFGYPTPSLINRQCFNVPPATDVVTAVDNCTTNVQVTFLETTNPGSCANAYLLTRTWSAADACGNAATVTQRINVTDTRAPDLSGVPADETNQCDNISPPASVTATDRCDEVVSVQFSETTNAGACAQSYTLVRLWSAVDSCGNATNGTQLVTVVDTTAPIITCATNSVTLQGDANCQAALPTLSATASDTCNTNVTIVQNPPAGTIITGDSNTLVTVTAIDACGNSNNCTVTVQVECSGSLKIEKTVYYGHDGGASCPGVEVLVATNGSPITYCLTVTNNGTVNLSNVAITDGTLSPSLVTNLGALGVGQVKSVYTERIDTGDLTNRASVLATDPIGGTHGDTNTAEVVDINPGIHIEKTVSSNGLFATSVETVADTNNHEVTYFFVVSNPGDVTLTNVIVNDAVLGHSTNLGSLVAGQSVTVSLDSVIGGDRTNTATATGGDPLGNVHVDTDTAVVFRVMSISGFVYVDVDLDGNFDPVDTNGIDGATVTLLDSVFSIVGVTTTDVNGAYAFLNLPPGTYTVVETDRLGYFSTGDVVPPNDNQVPVTLVSGINAVGRNFLDATSVDLDMDKTFLGVSEPSLSGNFTMTYEIEVANPTGSNAQVYNLIDTPTPDTNVTILGGTVSGYTNEVLVGAGPYTLSTNQLILPATSHTYIVTLNGVLSSNVMSGTTDVTRCGEFGLTVGQGLLNKAVMPYGTNGVAVTNYACGDIPPIILLHKDFIAASAPDSNGLFVVTYRMTADNNGGLDGTYTLIDTPTPDPNVTITGGVVSGQASLILTNGGPYVLASNNLVIAAGATHIYTMQLYAVLSPGVLNGSTNVSLCSGPSLLPSHGLFNSATVTYGTNNTTITTNACGDVPPIVVLKKSFVSNSLLDGTGNFRITYLLTAYNSGATAGLYDLTDTPNPDPNVTITGAVVSGQASLTFGSGGPYTLATDVALGAGVTHTYTVLLYAVLSPGVMDGTTNVTLCGTVGPGNQPGNGLYNQATVTYGTNDLTTTTNACGNTPPVPRYSLVKTRTVPVPGVPALVGGPITFTMVVTNSGDVDFGVVPFDDTYNAGLLSFVNATPSPDSTGPGTLSWTNVGPLAVGQTIVVTVNFTAIGLGEGTNTVVASPLTTNNVPWPPQTSSAPLNVVYPAIEVEKTVSLNGSCPGLELVQGTNTSPVTYCFVVTNAGDVALTNVYLTDPSITYSNFIGTLTVGQVVTVSVDRTITADLTNTVTASGRGPGGLPASDTDTAEVDLIAPSILVQKTASGGAGAFPGGELVQGTNTAPVVYWIVVSNPGDVTLTNVTLDDATITPPYSTNVGSLAAGQSKTVSVSRTITADLTNRVFAAGQDPNGSIYTNNDTARVDLIAPSIVVQKTASGGAGAFPGSELVQGTNTAPVVYWIVVSNPGDVTLTNVTLNDAFIGYSTNVGDLNAGQSKTVSVSRTITVDLTNRVFAEGQDPVSGIWSNNDTAAVDLIAPVIHIEKTVSGGAGTFPGGELVQGTNTAPVVYWFVVSNPGDVTLTNVSVNDVALGHTTNLGSLASGQSVTVSVDSAISGDLTNRAIAAGQDGNGSIYTNSDTAAVDLIAPSIHIEKTASGQLTGFAFPGAELVQGTNTAPVVYWLVVSNPGDVTLTNVTISDVTIGHSTNLGSLASGQSVTVSVSRTITADLVNTATAAGEDPNGASYNDDDTAAVDLTTPSIDVQKTASGQLTGFAFPGAELVQGTNGAPVTYWFVVTNPGDVTLTNVYLSDLTIGYSNFVGTLTAGQSVTVSVGRTITVDLTNLVTALGRDAVGNPYSDTDTAQVDLTTPSIDVQKTASGQLTGFAFPGAELVQGTNGAPVTYWFVVTNPGDVTLTNVTLTDATIGYTTNVGDLASGQSVTVSVDRTITVDLTNLVTALGRDAVGNPYSDTDTAQVDLTTPSIDVQKTASGQLTGFAFPGAELVQGTNGAPVTYWFVVTNPGDVALTNVYLSDLTIAYSNFIGNLAAGQSVTVSVGRTITVDLTNLVTALGRDAVGNPYSDTDTAQVDLTTPSIDVQKTASGQLTGFAFPGAELVQGTNGAPVTYWFVVTNPGDVTLTNVYLSDLTIAYSNFIGTLTAGQSVTVSVGRTITVDLTNLVTALGRDAVGNPYSDTDTAQVDLTTPSIDVQKTASGQLTGFAFPGAELVQGTNGAPVTYWFVVTNPGDVTLTNVYLSDLTIAYSNFIGNLAAGQSVTVSVGRTITVDLTNLVTALGRDAVGNPYSDTDTAQVDLTTPSIDVQKTASGQLTGFAFPGAELVQGTNGAPVTYWFVVTNPGDVTLTNVYLSDLTIAYSNFIGTLTAGQSVTVSVGRTITVDLTNLVTALGRDAVGNPYSDTDTAQVDLTTPSIDVQKTASGQLTGFAFPGAELVQGTNGAPVTYWFVVKNQGDVTLTNVYLSDLTIAYSNFIGNLAAGQSVTVSVGRTITVDLTNLVTALGRDAVGNPYSDTDTAQVDLTTPSIDVQKTASGQLTGFAFPGAELVQGTNGAPVTYWFVVKNPGDVALTNVYLSDLTIAYSNFIGNLAAGQSVTVSVGRTITVDLTNLVTALGRDAVGNPYSDTDTAQVDLTTPSIDVQKTASGQLTGFAFPGAELVQGTNGAPVTYWFVVTNPGDVTLTNVTLTDATIGYTTNVGDLASGQSVTVSVGRTITVDLTNLVTALGRDAVGNPYSDTDTAQVDLTTPSIDVQKTASGQLTGFAFPGAELVQGTNGAPVTYWFVVKNQGDVTLTNVYLSDLTIAYSNFIGNLAAGQSVTVSVGRTITVDLTNLVTALGRDAVGNPYSDTDTAQVDLTTPSIDVQKTASGQLTGFAFPGAELVQGTNGAPVTYWFVVTNPGDVTLTNVTLTDATIGYTTNVGDLASGQSVTVSVDRTITVDLTNLVTALGRDAVGNPYSDTDTAQVDLTTPSIDVQKTASGQLTGFAFPGAELVQGTNGAPVTYWFVVTNPGDVALTNVYLSDLTIAYSNFIGNLAAGQSVTVSVGRTITVDLTNLVTALGRDAVGNPYSDTDTAQVDLTTPSIDVQKTASGQLTGFAFPGAELVQGTNGAPVTYWFVVTNPGDVTLTNVYLSDLTIAYSNFIGTLTAGQSVTVSVGRAITVDLTNLVTALGRDAVGNPYSDTDTAQVDLTTPSIDVQKTASGQLTGFAFPGAELVQGTNGAPVTYWFVVKNQGDVTLTNVYLSDLTIAYSNFIGNLAAGQSVTVSVGRTITVDLTNLVTALGRDAVGNPYSDTDTAQVDLTTPSIDVQKTASGQLTGFAFPGAELVQGTNGAPVTYWFVVKNQGDVTLTNVYLSDLTIAYSNFIGNLAAGQSVTVSVGRTITVDLTNLVTALGRDAVGNPYSDTDTAQVDLTTPSIDVQKTASGQLTGFAFPGAELVQGTNGAPVTYWFVVKNQGDVTLTNVYLSDLTIAYSNFIGNLAAGQSVTVSVGRTITVDLTNLVTALGRDAVGNPYSDTDTAQVDLTTPSIDVQKTASGQLTGFAFPGAELVQGTNGAPVTYWFVVKNPGDVALTNVYLSDLTIAYSNFIGNLAAGQSVTVSVGRTITVDLTNLVTALGRDAVGNPYSDTDTAQVDLTTPSIDVQKTASGQLTGFAFPGAELVQGTNGAPVTYWFVVKNQGDVTLTNVYLSDLTIAYSNFIGNLAAGQSVTVSVGRTITVDLTNLVTALGRDAVGNPYSDTDTAQVDLTTPSIDVQKTASGQLTGFAFPGAELVQGTNGAPVTYWFVVKNQGDVTLTNVYLSDLTIAYSNFVGTLTAGQSVTVSVGRTITVDLTNLVTALGRDAVGNPYSDTDTAQVDRIAPTILVQKTASGGAGTFPGSELVQGTNTAPVVYWIVVSNPGDVTLTNVTLTDAFIGHTTNVGSLAAGQSKTVSVARTITADLTNRVFAAGQDPVSGVWSNNDTAAVDLIAPNILVQKTVSGGAGTFPGSELVQGTNTAPVVYWIVVSNPGDVTLTNVTLTDAFIGHTTNVGSLAAGQSKTVSVARTITADLTNRVFATGRDPVSGIWSNNDTAAVDLIAPSILVQKTVSGGAGTFPGSELVQGTNTAPVVYWIVVSNPGDVTLTNVTLTDAFIGHTTNVGSLAAGQSKTVSVARTITADLTNRVFATGRDPVSGIWSNNDTAAVDLIAPSILVQKTVSGGAGTFPGSELVQGTNTAPVVYWIVVSNPGDVTLTNVTLNDAFIGYSTNVGSLAAGQSKTVSVARTITADLTNRVFAAGQDPVSGIWSNNDTAQVVQLLEISGFVLRDADADGIFDPEDVTNGLPSVTVQLLDAASNVVATTSTSATGFYEFTNLVKGTYTVVETDPAGYVSTADIVPPNDNRIPVVLGVADSTGNNFLDTPTGRIGDFVWYDLNGNGLQNGSEPGLPNVKLSLLTTNGTTLMVITSGVNGVYFFNNLPPASYVLRVSVLIGFGLSPKDVGVNDDVDNDFDPLTLQSGIIALAPGEVRTNVDVGLYSFVNFAQVAKVAGRVDAGRAILTWETETEQGTAGWYVERRDDAGNWRRVSSFLPAIGTTPVGGTYAWHDAKAEVGATYTYRLIEIESRGITLVLGPYEITFKASRTSTTSNTLDLGTDGYASQAKSAAPSSIRTAAAHQLIALAAGPVTAVKVQVKQSGLHRVTGAELAAAYGVSTSAVAAKVLRVENLGLDVASQRDGADVVFYGQGYESVYTDANVYWIVEGAGLAAGTQTVVPAAGSAQVSFADTVKLEKQQALRADLFEDESSDVWLWSQLISGIINQFQTSLGLPGLLGGSGGELVVKLKGSSSAGGQYEHGAQIQLNGTTLGQTNFNGLESLTVVLNVPAGLWVENGNTVKVVSVPPGAPNFDSFYVDGVEARYARRYEAVSNRLVMTANAGAVRVTGVNGTNAVVWEVTDPWHATRLTGVGVEATAVNFQAAHGGTYAVSGKGQERAADGVAAAYANDLKAVTNAADYVVVAGAGLESGAQQLADYRASKGLQAKVVGIESVYDAFNYGIRDGRALKAFLGYAYRQWAKSPRYVTLVGDGSMDYRNYLGFGDSSVPTPQAGGLHGVYVSDHSLGDITGDGLLEMAVGRIPANSAAQLTAAINKIVNYEAGGAWRSKVLISTDDSDQAGDYLDNGNRMADLVVGRTIQRADLAVEGFDNASADLKAGVGGGRDMVLYIGHGNVKRMAEEGLMTATDAVGLTNASTPGVVGAFGCLMGSFGLPGQLSLGEQMLADGGGAAAMFGAGTLVGNADSCFFGENLLSAVYAPGQARLGDAWVSAKNTLTQGGLTPAASAYQLLGDPATAMGSSTAPRGGPAVSPARGSYAEWQTWAFGPSGTDMGLSSLANSDPDGDGNDNWAEYMAGTDPLDGDSRLMMVRIRTLANGQLEVRWPSAPARYYRIERAPSARGTYTVLADDVAATASENMWIDATPGNAVGVYRVIVK